MSHAANLMKYNCQFNEGPKLNWDCTKEMSKCDTAHIHPPFVFPCHTLARGVFSGMQIEYGWSFFPQAITSGAGRSRLNAVLACGLKKRGSGTCARALVSSDRIFFLYIFAVNLLCGLWQNEILPVSHLLISFVQSQFNFGPFGPSLNWQLKLDI